MKSAAISRFVIVAAIAALIGTAGVTPLLAQISFTNFSSTTGLTLNGSATTAVNANSLNVLRLTPDGATHVSGTAWFGTAQPVTGTFSTTFKFQITHNQSLGGGPADGLAFVIQNAGTAALGGSGGAIGYGVPDPGDIGTPISNSLAIEFDTYQNGWDPDANHVAVQSCGTGPNSQDHTGTCKIGVASLGSLVNLSDGNPHTATITFGSGLLDVILDGNDLFPQGLTVNFSTLLSLTSGNAFVGFTGSTGGSFENNDIISWTFTPQAQTTVVSPAQQATVNFPNANGENNVYAYSLQTATATVAATIKPTLQNVATCNALVQRNFWPARCFVYQDAQGSGLDAAVMFAVTCPQTGSGTCTGVNFSELGTTFTFKESENPLFVFPGVLGLLNPFPGWLKADSGPDPLNPCTPPASGAFFQSNQVAAFSVVGDPGGSTIGKSKGGASCWVATYDTPGEALPGIKINTPPLFPVKTFKLGTTQTASYVCSDPSTSKDPNVSNTGPYLTLASCKQSFLPKNSAFNTNTCTVTSGKQTCSGNLDTSTGGLHTLVVTAIDTGGNTNVNVVLYNVK